MKISTCRGRQWITLTQKSYIKKMLEDPVLYIDTISYEHFEEDGLGLDIHRTTIEGPFKAESPADKRRREMQVKLIETGAVAAPRRTPVRCWRWLLGRWNCR